MVTLNYSYRIYPDSEQQKRLDEWLETSRQVYNYALGQLQDWLRSRKSPVNACSIKQEYIIPAEQPFPSYQAQQNALPKAKKENPSLKDIPSQTLQCVIRQLYSAWDWFRARGYGFPRFKKIGRFRSLLFPQFKGNPLTEWQIKLPKLGLVQINLHRPIPEGFLVKQVRVIKKAGKWFATIAIYADFSIPEPLPHGNAIGIDCGLEKFIATSDGYLEKPPRFFRDLQSRLKVLQRRLSRKKKRSANYQKAAQKVARLHHQISDTRKNYHYQLSHKLCDMASTIFMEDLDFRITAKGFLGKQMLDGGFGQFRNILKWVCKRRGVYFDVVDSRGTSQECPNCQCEVKKDLSVRWHSCPECGYECDRDVASAQVIRDRGLKTVPVDKGKRKPPAESVLAGSFGSSQVLAPNACS